MMASLIPYVSTAYQCVGRGDEAKVELYLTVELRLLTWRESCDEHQQQSSSC
jgi:hypothetical protein